MRSLITPLPLVPLAVASLLALFSALPIQAAPIPPGVSAPTANGPPDAVPLVTDGGSDYVIVTGKDPSATVELAAGELARYIEKISGTRLRILPEAGERQARRRVIELRLKSGGKGLERLNRIDPADDAYGIEVSGDGGILLEGATGRALLYAVYHFLERLGCRFLAPQLDFYAGSAEIVPRAASRSIPVGRTRSQPVMAYRKIYVEEGHSHNESNLREMIGWMPKAGYNVLVVPMDYQGQGEVKWDNWRRALTPELQSRGIIIEVGGHGFQNFLNADTPAPGGGGRTLFDAHPDWFARDADGNRRRESNWVFNTANPDAVGFLVRNVVQYVAERPEIRIFDFWPPDRAQFDESPEGRSQGTPIDRLVSLTNRVQVELEKVRPDVRLEVTAYARYVDPPESQEFRKDVLLDFCPIFQNFETQLDEPGDVNNVHYAAALRGWRQSFDGDICLYSYYRKYAWQSLPVIIPHYMQRDIQWFASLPLQGISTYAEPGDWFTYELNHYVLPRLAWNPQADVDEIVAEFCRTRYGAAAAAAGHALLVMGDIERSCGSVMFTSLKSSAQIRAAQEKLARAVAPVREAAKNPPDSVAAQHLRRLELMCLHAEADLEIQLLRAQDGDAAEIRRAIADLHRFAVEHRDEGVFLVHGRRFSLDGLLGRLRYRFLDSND